MSGIIPPDRETPPQDATGIGTEERGFPDVRKATGDARLGAMLRDMRRDDGRGLKEAAHACGVSDSAMSAYEKGLVMPSVPVLARLSHYYGVSADALIRHLKDGNTAA